MGTRRRSVSLTDARFTYRCIEKLIVTFPLGSILALHYHFAILITTSPLLMQDIEPISHASPSQTGSVKSPLLRDPVDRPGTSASGRGGIRPGPFALWEDLSADHAGHEMLARARDSAVALIRSICSPEIARTLH